MQDTRKVRLVQNCCCLALYSQKFCSSFTTFCFCLDIVFIWFLWLWEEIPPCTSPSGCVCRREGPCHALQRELPGHGQRSPEQRLEAASLVWKQVSSRWIISKSKHSSGSTDCIILIKASKSSGCPSPLKDSQCLVWLLLSCDMLRQELMALFNQTLAFFAV